MMTKIMEKFPFDPNAIPSQIQEIAVVGGSWRDMGRQYVQQFREKFLARTAELLGEYLATLGSAEKVDSIVHRNLQATKNEFPQLVELIQGMADEAGVRFEDAALTFYGKSMLRIEQTCSHVAAWGDATKDGHLITAANMDFGCDNREYLPAVLAFPEDGNAFISSDLFHRDCLNEKGLLLQGSGCHSSGPDTTCADGDPKRHLWNDVNVYAIAYCSSAKEALDKYKSWEYISGSNQFFGDQSHDTYMLEFHAHKKCVRRAGDNDEAGSYLMENNGSHCKDMCFPEGIGTPYFSDVQPRYWSVEQKVKENLGNITLQTLFDAEGSYKYYIPEGWSFADRGDGVRVWVNNDSDPFPAGWHEDWDIKHGLWAPQPRAHFFRTCIRHAMDADTLTYYTMKGQTNTMYTCTPGTTGTFWKVQLGGSVLDVVLRARKELEMQIWLAQRDTTLTAPDDTARIKAIEEARACLFKGINHQGLGSSAAELTTQDEMFYHYGQAITAYCEGQCKARIARDNPISFD